MSAVSEACRKASGLHLAQGLPIDRKSSSHWKVAWTPEGLHPSQVHRTRRRLQKRGLLLEKRSECRISKEGLPSGGGRRSGSDIGCCSSRKSSDQVVEAQKVWSTPDKDLSRTTGDSPLEQADEKADQVLVHSQNGIDGLEDRDRAPSGATGIDSSASQASTSDSNSWQDVSNESALFSNLRGIGETLLLISPFFFWGTAMVAMKEVLPKAGPLFVAATRLLPAGGMLIGFTMFRGKSNPNTAMAWLAVALFALVDGTMFQVSDAC